MLPIINSRFIYCLLILLFSIAGKDGFGQNQANIWYFGTAGLDFNSGLPSVLTNNPMNTALLHSTACIADTNGNLLFFTDGEDVWNRNMEIMVNGTGLEGDKFNHQSSIICKDPGSQHKYYVFTVGGEENIFG